MMSPTFIAELLLDYSYRMELAFRHASVSNIYLSQYFSWLVGWSLTLLHFHLWRASYTHTHRFTDPFENKGCMKKRILKAHKDECFGPDTIDSSGLSIAHSLSYDLIIII